MSPSLRQRLFSRSKDTPPSTAHSVELSSSTGTTLTPDTENTFSEPTSAATSVPFDSDRDHAPSLNMTLTNNHRVPFYRRRRDKSETALSSSSAKAPPRRRRGKQSFLSRVVHRVVPCVPDTPASPLQPSTLNDDRLSEFDSPSHNNPQLISPGSPVLDIPSTRFMTGQSNSSSIDYQVIIPPPPATQLLPPEETDGVTSGAVQPPGSTGEPIARIPTRDSDDSDATSYMEDDVDDIQVYDEQAEEERLIRNGGAGIPIGPDGVARPLLPPLASHHFGRKCLVLDLDETLVHSSFKAVPNADFVVPVEIEYTWHHFHVLKRPGVDNFLKRMGEHYEIVVYTASLSKYADPVLDKLDIHQVVTHRLFRESCFSHKGNYIKDLSQLGRRINDTIILDNSPASYIFHPHNAVPVSSWFNDPHDAELTDLIPFLVDLTSVPDVRGILDVVR